MPFKISDDIGKVGEYYPVDFSKEENIYDEDCLLEREGLYVMKDGSLFLVKGEYAYVYKGTRIPEL